MSSLKKILTQSRSSFEQALIVGRKALASNDLPAAERAMIESMMADAEEKLALMNDDPQKLITELLKEGRSQNASRQ